MGLGQHPRPYLSSMFWLLLRKGLRLIKRPLTAMQEATPDDQESDYSDENDYVFVKKEDNSTALTQFDEYLPSPSTEMMTVTAWPLIERLLCKTNTFLPASATCKHLFSAAGHIFTPMGACIGDTNFENQLLLKLSKGFVQWTQGGSRCAHLWIFLSPVYIWLLVYVLQ